MTSDRGGVQQACYISPPGSDSWLFQNSDGVGPVSELVLYNKVFPLIYTNYVNIFYPAVGVTGKCQ